MSQIKNVIKKQSFLFLIQSLSLIAALWFFLTNAQAANPTPASANSNTSQLKQLEYFNQHTQSLSGNFTQTGKQTASGRFTFLRPGKFNWHVQKPYEQRLISDGKQFTWHDADIEQVVIRPLENALEDSPVALLFGHKRLSDLFELRNVQGNDGDKWVEWVEGKPKKNSAFYKTVRLSFEQNLPKRMVLEDNFGKKTQIEFQQLKANTKVNPQEFQFKIPASATVIKDGVNVAKP